MHFSLLILALSVLYCSADEENNFKNGLKENGFDNKLIFDGSFVDIETYPFVVGILYNGGFTCGGSIINENWVLTAAHCMFEPNGNERDASSLVVSSGNADVSSGTQTDVSSIFLNPNFRYGAFSNDIALLQLSSSLAFDATTQPVALPYSYQDTSPGVEATVIGWGYTEDGEESQDLKYTTVQTIDPNDCNSAFNLEEIPIAQDQLCAYAATGSSGHCTGDSGGPLVMQGTGGLIQVGVVSFSQKPCGISNYPGVYTKVSYFIDFIQSYTG